MGWRFPGTGLGMLLRRNADNELKIRNAGSHDTIVAEPQGFGTGEASAEVLSLRNEGHGSYSVIVRCRGDMLLRLHGEPGKSHDDEIAGADPAKSVLHIAAHSERAVPFCIVKDAGGEVIAAYPVSEHGPEVELTLTPDERCSRVELPHAATRSVEALLKACAAA